MTNSWERASTGGSGSLKGFNADVTVTIPDSTIWHWNGVVSDD